jgi:hypothetical protein
VILGVLERLVVRSRQVAVRTHVDSHRHGRAAPQVTLDVAISTRATPRPAPISTAAKTAV